jgi:hypothetical protein
VRHDLQHIVVVCELAQAVGDLRRSDLDDGSGDPAVEESLRRALHDDAAAVHEREPIAKEGLVHVMRRDQYADAAFREFVHEFPELSAGERIDPGRGLVQEQDFGLVQQRGRHGQCPLVTQRQARRARCGVADKIDSIERPVDPHPRPRLVEPVEPGLQGEVLAYRQIAIECEALRDVADMAARCARVANHVDSGNANFTARRWERSAQHADRRRLACAVGTQEAEHFAVAHGEIDSVDGNEITKAPRQAARVDGILGSVSHRRYPRRTQDRAARHRATMVAGVARRTRREVPRSLRRKVQRRHRRRATP